MIYSGVEVSNLNKPALDLNNWIENAGAALATTAFTLMDKHAGDKGVEVQKMLAMNFVTHVMTGIIAATLNHRPETITTKRAMTDYNIEAFAKIKMDIQNAVSTAFSAAMEHYTGIQSEYYCSIKMLAPSPSKETQ